MRRGWIRGTRPGWRVSCGPIRASFSMSPRATSVARHGRSNRRGGLRPHGPGGGPEGGGEAVCAAPGGGAIPGPARYGGAAPKKGVGRRTINAYATATRMTVHEPTKALIRAEERTDTKADTMGSPAEEAKARGTEITVPITPARMDAMRIAPNRDQRWPRVIRQLLERPPTAFAFSIMIAGA